MGRSQQIKIIALLFSIPIAFIWLSSYFFVTFLKVDVAITPWIIFQYLTVYAENKAVTKAALKGFGSAFAIFMIPVAFLIFEKIQKSKKSLHGDAKMATMNDIKKAGLIADGGIILGKKGGQYLQFDGNQHVIVVAPTRSGKGVGIVIPNLLNWKESVVVLDIKQENWDITSKFRQEKLGNECFLFNPLSEEFQTHKYNPLDYISEDPALRINDIMKIATMLYPSAGNGDEIWTATPRNLFVGIVLMLFETNKPRTMHQVLLMVSEGDGSEYLELMITKHNLSENCIVPLRAYTSIASDNTRSGIISGFRAALALWTNPLIQKATESSDFDFRDLRKKKISIFVGVSPNNLKMLQPLINLFFQQLIDVNTRKLPEQDAALKYQCLLLMDEFTAMGKVDVLLHGISFVAGYNLRVMPIIQSESQLASVYGKDDAKTFMVNHACYVVFAPKASDTDSAEQLSKTLGFSTVKSRSKSRNLNPWGNLSGSSTSENDQQRAVMLPQEISNMGEEKELIIIENTPPILANKIRYYKDENFLMRLRSVSQVLLNIKRIKPQDYQEAFRNKELAAHVPFLAITEEKNSLKEESLNTILTTFEVKLNSLSFNDYADDEIIDEKKLKAYADNLCQLAEIGAY